MSSTRAECEWVDIVPAQGGGVAVRGRLCRAWCEVLAALPSSGAVLYSEQVPAMIMALAPQLVSGGSGIAGDIRVEFDRMRVVVRGPNRTVTVHDTSRIAEAGIPGPDTLPALRRAGDAAGLAPRGLSSPTAISSAILRRSGVEWRDPWADHARRAYYGGRFQTGYLGHLDGPVYRYDIRAAYLAAMVRLPRPGGRWVEHASKMKTWPEHSWWYGRVDWRGEPGQKWNPLPVRVTGGCEWGQTAQVYPSAAAGWYPADILTAALRPGDVREWCEYVPPDDSEPLRSVLTDAYEVRQALRASDPPAAVVLKAAINAVYGKLCQVNGRNAERWRNFAMAGWITAHTAAQLWRAITLKPGAVVSVLTDGIISTEQLELEFSGRPGTWSLEAVYDELFVARASAYWERQGETWSCHWAGHPTGTVDRQAVMEHWRKYGPHKRIKIRGEIGELLRPEWGMVGWYAKPSAWGGMVDWFPPSPGELRRWEYDALGQRVAEGRGGDYELAE